MQVKKTYTKREKEYSKNVPKAHLAEAAAEEEGAAAKELKKRGSSRRRVLAPNFNATLSHLSDATCKMLPTAV